MSPVKPVCKYDTFVKVLRSAAFRESQLGNVVAAIVVVASFKNFLRFMIFSPNVWDCNKGGIVYCLQREFLIIASFSSLIS